VIVRIESADSNTKFTFNNHSIWWAGKSSESLEVHWVAEDLGTIQM
jgi:hypothetical protein